MSIIDKVIYMTELAKITLTPVAKQKKNLLTPHRPDAELNQERLHALAESVPALCEAIRARDEALDALIAQLRAAQDRASNPPTDEDTMRAHFLLDLIVIRNMTSG